MNILISGASGLIGSALATNLAASGHTVRKLVRHHPSRNDEYFWNPDQKVIDADAFQNLDSIVHLAGAPISKRWSSKYKKTIIDSRVQTAELLHDHLIQKNVQLKSFISASGINYYGTFTSDKILTEEDPVIHDDFLSEVCGKWEKAAKNFEKNADRVVCIRTAVVLSGLGGAFEPLRKMTKRNLAAAAGSGKQWFPWIHLYDLVQIYAEAIVNPLLNGAYNAVADEIPQNKEFMRILAKKMHKVFLPFRIPTIVLESVLGEMSEMILTGTRASNQKLKKSGFMLKFPTISSALSDLLSPK